MTETMTVDDGNFATEVLSSERPVLVDFSATWCPPCRALEPTIDELAKESDGSYRVVKVDVDKSPRTADAYRIRAVPTVLLFRDGAVVESIVGAGRKEQYLKALRAAQG